MSNRELEEFKVALKAFRAEHANTPEKARKVLHDEGVITKRGKLTKLYAASSAKKMAKAS